MITEKGRVVYDRKRNYFSPKDVARILDSYSDEGTGKTFGEFVWGIVDLTLKRQPRARDFLNKFWQVFWDYMLKKGVYDPEGGLEDLLMRLLTPDPQRLKKQKELLPTPETQAEKKRRLARERR